MKGKEKDVDEQIQKMMEQPSGKMKKKRGIVGKLVIGIVVIVLAVFAVKKFMPKKKTLPMVSAQMLEKGNIDDTLVITGPIEGSDSVDITSGLHSKVTELLVKEGDHVEAGAVLAKIDPEDIQKNIQTAKGAYELKVAQKEAKQKEDQKAYEKALADVDTAQQNFNRQSELVAAGAAPQAELDNAQKTLDDAKRVVDGFDVEGGKVIPDQSFDIDIQNAQTELDQLNKKLDDVIIKAPISGTITRVNTKVGQFADGVDATQSKGIMMSIENLQNLQMELDISEYNIGKVKIGQAVSISADILGEGNTVRGEVTSISPTGEKKSETSTERVIPVKVKIVDANTALISGITAKAKIVLDSAQDAYIVPISAIGDDGTGKTVIQILQSDGNDGYTVHIVPVETGIEDDINAQLKENPMPGEDKAYSYYVKTYDTKLTEGEQVQLQTGENDSTTAGDTTKSSQEKVE